MKCDMCKKEVTCEEYEEDGIKVTLCKPCSEMVDGIMRNSEEICNEV